MKACSNCRIEKPLTLFAKNKTRKDGLMPSCRGCEKTRNADYYQRNKEAIKARAKKYKRSNSKMAKAHCLITNAINAGWLKRPEKCSNCNKTSKKSIQAHHPDYNYPFVIIWLCNSCHRTMTNAVK